ncbi:MAG: hypothetical protein HRU20_16945 [Pseudomonadales bacterium]|nr:hypothetical protein [Pseudomonadales bacterium]
MTKKILEKINSMFSPIGIVFLLLASSITQANINDSAVKTASTVINSKGHWANQVSFDRSCFLEIVRLNGRVIG